MNIVPQLFYDLIARIIPSIGVLLSLGFTFLVGKDFLKTGELGRILKSGYIDYHQYFNIWSAILLLIIAYITSLILKVPSETLSNTSWFRRLMFIGKSKTDDVLISERERLKKMNEDSVPDIWTMFSIVRVKLPDEGMRLLKMYAEIRMCELLIFGFSICFIINAICWVIALESFVPRVSWCLLLLIFTRSLMSVKQSITNSLEKSILMSWSIYKGYN